jgi:hypothetical protein
LLHGRSVNFKKALSTSRNNHLEVQQRASELLRVLADGALAEQMLAPADDDTEATSSSPEPGVSLLDIPDPAGQPSSSAGSPRRLPISSGAVEALSGSDYVLQFRAAATCTESEPACNSQRPPIPRSTRDVHVNQLYVQDTSNQGGGQDQSHL